MPKRPQQQEDATPAEIKPYLFHGIDLTWRKGDKEALGPCPFCGKEQKFSVDIKTSKFKCWACLESGNSVTFLRKLYDLSFDSTQYDDYSQLAESRGILLQETLVHWGWAKSITTGLWLIPGFNPKGEICTLYQYMNSKGGKKRLFGTSGMKGQIFGLNQFHTDREVVYVTEGPWDAMALWEVLSHSKNQGDGLKFSSNPSQSLLSGVNVIAIPGCNFFKPEWCSLFKEKVVNFLFDNDHSKPHPRTGEMQEPPAYVGLKRLVGILSSSKEAPDQINFLCWNPETPYFINLEEADGKDVRDHFMEASPDSLSGRVKALSPFLDMLQPVPEELLEGADHAVSEGDKSGKESGLESLPCSDYRSLVTSWRKAMKWTEGLDCALSVMLSSITSTMMVGDQLWVKIIGPASCLSGETPIYNPVDGTYLPIQERYVRGQKFSVLSKLQDGTIGIAQALPPTCGGKSQMLKLTLKSGMTLKVTPDHQIWTGEKYATVRELAKFSNVQLPSISVFDPSIRERDVCHSTQTTEDSQSNCSACLNQCGEQLHGVGDTSQDGSPLPVDAQTHTPLHSQMDAPTPSSKCNHIYQQPDPLSNSHVPFHASLTPCGNESQFPIFGEQNERDACGSGESLHIQTGTFQIGIGQQLVESGLKSKHHELQSPLLSEPLRQLPDQLSTSQQSHVESDLTDKGPHTDDVFESTMASFVTPIHDQSKLDHLTLGEWDEVIKIEEDGEGLFYDFHVPLTNNYIAGGIVHHNCGKSTLCEAVSINKEYVHAKSTIRGFHSGWKPTSGEEQKDASLLNDVKDKTLVTKDGDTLLQAPNLGQILSEARDIYDRTSRTHYRHGMSKDYAGISMTWILCGTSSLRSIDSSELGERFLDCTIMEGIDTEFEDEVLFRVAHRAERNLALETDNDPLTQQDPDMTEAMQLTGGYISYLRENAASLYAETEMDDEGIKACIHFGKFVAYMRARPSKLQEEQAEREFGARLVSQMVRLAKSLAVVLNKKLVDLEVLKRTRKVALDTARGVTLKIADKLFEHPEGLTTESIAMLTVQTPETTRKLLRFLAQIEVVESFSTKTSGVSSKVKWRLQPKLKELYRYVQFKEEVE